MKLAMSQIAWPQSEEAGMLAFLAQRGFAGVEIAPTRVAGPTPYEDAGTARRYADDVKRQHGLVVCSMQSIWYGQAGSMFGPERADLLRYTQKAILFAEAACCGNLVFGCPKNRVLPEGESPDAALSFFKELGDFAAAHGTHLSLEANPALYGTNFVNTTAEALAMAQQVQSPGFKVNLDFGTIIANGESVAALAGQVGAINHVHISEPNLVPIEKRDGHRQLAALLRQEGYEGYVSIEMREAPEDVRKAAVEYIAEVFG